MLRPLAPNDKIEGPEHLVLRESRREAVKRTVVGRGRKVEEIRKLGLGEVG